MTFYIYQSNRWIEDRVKMKFSNVNGQKKKGIPSFNLRSFVYRTFVDKNSYFINNFPKIYPTFWKSDRIDHTFVVVDVVVALFGTKNLSLSPRRGLRENGGGCKKRSRIPWDEKRCSRNGARVVKRKRKAFPLLFS